MKKHGFTQLGISEALSQALVEHGYKEPTPIQRDAIPVTLSGNDVIAQAQTGTGKTLAFILPILETIDSTRSYVQALVVTPTRELAIQITEEVKRWAPLKELKVLSAYGGQDVDRQIRQLEGSIHIIIATPGRLLDHIRRGTVQLHKLSVLVLDEADQMLHMGFLPEVEEIISVTPGRKQTLLFSATMPSKIRQLAKQFMHSPVEIEIKSKRITLEEIEQIVVKTTDRGKLDALCKTIDEENPYLAMIFCRTKLRASKLNNELLERGYASDELHGDLTQAKREQVMKRFREAKIQLLVATDIAARGLDVEGITHVINYDIPHDAESYIHRIGRTGRAGETGKAITFAAPRDSFYLEQIEKAIKQDIQKRAFKSSGTLDDGENVSEKTGRSKQAPKRPSGAGVSRRRKDSAKNSGSFRRSDSTQQNERQGQQESERGHRQAKRTGPSGGGNRRNAALKEVESGARPQGSRSRKSRDMTLNSGSGGRRGSAHTQGRSDNKAAGRTAKRRSEGGGRSQGRRSGR